MIIGKKLLFFVLLFSLARAFHYFCDVAMPPTQEVFTNLDSVAAAMKVAHFEKMYEDKEMTSLLKV